MLYGPLSKYQSCTAEGIRRGRQQLFREIERLIGKPSEKLSQEDKPWPHWQLPCSWVHYLNGIHGIHHKNGLGLN
jgi:hypothetical protein